MRPQFKVAVVHNQPALDRYEAMGEGRAVAGVVDAAVAVERVLREAGHTVSRVPLSPPLYAAAEKVASRRPDVVFNLFEGFEGHPETEAEFAGILSGLGMRFTGCPEHSLALSLDKGKAKAALLQSGIPTPAYQVLSPCDLDDFRLCFPCIVKPCAEDASHGLCDASVVHHPVELDRQVRKVSDLFGGRALVEEFVDGPELNATVLGNSQFEVLPLAEIAYSLPAGVPRILTYAAKWEPDSAHYQSTPSICPARLDSAQAEQARQLSQRVFQVFGCRGYARVDLRMDSRGRTYVLEVNPNPDISPDAGAARQAKAAGMTYGQLVQRILLLGLGAEDA